MSGMSRSWSLFELTADQWFINAVGPIINLQGMSMGSFYTATAAPSWTFMGVSGPADGGAPGPGTELGDMFGADAAALPTMTFTLDGWTTIPWEYFQVPFIQINGPSTVNKTLVYIKA